MVRPDLELCALEVRAQRDHSPDDCITFSFCRRIVALLLGQSLGVEANGRPFLLVCFVLLLKEDCAYGIRTRIIVNHVWTSTNRKGEDWWCDESLFQRLERFPLFFRRSNASSHSTSLSFLSISVSGVDVLAKPLMKRRYTLHAPRKLFMAVTDFGNVASLMAAMALASGHALRVPGRIRNPRYSTSSRKKKHLFELELDPSSLKEFENSLQVL